MNQNDKGKAAHWFASLATGTKMLIILGLALLPLGIVAILASVNAARTSRASDEIEVQSVLAVANQRLASTITEAGVIVRATGGAISDSDPAAAARACDRAAVQLSENRVAQIKFAVYAGGYRAVCRSQGFDPGEPPVLPPGGALSVVRIDPQGRHLRYTLFDPSGTAQGVLEIPAAVLSQVASPSRAPMPLELELTGEGGAIQLFDDFTEGLLTRKVNLSSRLLSDRLELRLRGAAQALSWFEIMMIVLPLLMWLLAAVIGWLIIDRLLLRPLGAMQKAISAYRPGETGFKAPAAKSPAREISDLGDAFDQVTRTVASHEAELEAAVERQTKLVREVHHRVKNNLQVVASLLNIHSRGSSSAEAAAAYASIQRRVDALAVVHRNHYAELEKTPGVALRALISELGASLRASAPAGASRMQIRLALEPLYTNQDVAVSVAFLITETVEFAMLCSCNSVTIALESEEPGRARLSIESAALAAGASCSADIAERFERIITGLARQLRSTPERDMETGRFSLSIAIVGSDEAGEGK
ncbi:MAG TPA: sensor histidine kinase [Allosphingosinicella sp.]|nr:sensor histidine kinase [Allosphingosinicella sp.]